VKILLKIIFKNPIAFWLPLNAYFNNFRNTVRPLSVMFESKKKCWLFTLLYEQTLSRAGYDGGVRPQ
jgi:hypothetical protein